MISDFVGFGERVKEGSHRSGFEMHGMIFETVGERAWQSVPAQEVETRIRDLHSSKEFFEFEIDKETPRI